MATYDEKLVDGKALDQLSVGIYEKLKTKIDEKPNTTVTGGKGVTVSKSGDDYTINVSSANEGILVNANNIELNVVDDLVTGGAKRPLSAEQGKVLKQLLDTKAEKNHTHTVSEISGLPTALKNPTALSIQLNGGTATSYDGSEAKSINITPASIGAQAAGSYATTSQLGSYMPLSGNSTKTGVLTVDELVSNGNVTAYSDEKAKKNLRLLNDNVIEKLKKIKFYNYEMINDTTDRKHVGVKANELKELFPELVLEDSNGILRVDYTGLNLYFSFAIQQTMLKGLGE